MGAVGYILKPAKREQLVSAFRLLEERLTRDKKSILIVEDEGVQRAALIDLLVLRRRRDRRGRDRRGGPARDRQPAVRLRRSRPDAAGRQRLRVPGARRAATDGARAAAGDRLYGALARASTRSRSCGVCRNPSSSKARARRSDSSRRRRCSCIRRNRRCRPSSSICSRSRAAATRVLDGRRLLLVEDDVRNIFSLTAVLESEGVAVQIARNGREALERIDRRSRRSTSC